MTTLNVLNPKALEKQIKIVDARLSELSVELEELEKIKAACQILLGKPTLDAKKKKDETEPETSPSDGETSPEPEPQAPLN